MAFPGASRSEEKKRINEKNSKSSRRLSSLSKVKGLYQLAEFGL